MKKIEKQRNELLAIIRQHMTANDITQDKLADLTDRSQNSLSRILNGKYATKVDTLIEICNAVGLAVKVEAA